MKPEGLAPGARKSLDLTAKLFAQTGVYLAGGTGVALHLGHRWSDDLDFFTDDPDFPVETAVTAPLTKVAPPVRFEARSADGMVAYVGRHKGKVSCFRLPDVSQLDPTTEFEGLEVAELRDLLAMKLLAMYQRGRLRDFLDLWAIEQQTDLNVEQGLDWFPDRYPTRSAAELRSLVLHGLAFFERAESDVMPRLLNCRINKRQLRQYWFERAVSITRGAARTL